MVDPVSNNGVNSLLRAQQGANVTGSNAVKQQPTIINQTRSAAVVPVKATSITQTQSIKLAGTPDKIVPRGSLVDTVI